MDRSTQSEDPEDVKPEDKQDQNSAISWEQLSQGRTEVLIELLGKVYRLRKTRNGGLILNK